MTASTNGSPVFPGLPRTKGVAAAASSIANYTAYTADATNGSVVESIQVHEKGTGAATLQLAIVDGGNTYILGRCFTSGTQFANQNILTNSNFKWIDDANPQLRLAPSQVLQLQVINSVANALDVVSMAADFTA